MNEEIYCITKKGKTTMNVRENDDWLSSSFMQCIKNLGNSFSILYLLSTVTSYKHSNKLISITTFALSFLQMLHILA